MCISQGCANISVPQQFLNYPQIATVRDHECGGSMSAEYMNAALFRYACSFLVGCEYRMQSTLGPSLPVVCKKQRRSSIDVQLGANCEISLQDCCTLVVYENDSVSSTLTLTNPQSQSLQIDIAIIQITKLRGSETAVEQGLKHSQVFYVVDDREYPHNVFVIKIVWDIVISFQERIFYLFPPHRMIFLDRERIIIDRASRKILYMQSLSELLKIGCGWSIGLCVFQIRLYQPNIRHPQSSFLTRYRRDAFRNASNRD